VGRPGKLSTGCEKGCTCLTHAPLICVCSKYVTMATKSLTAFEKDVVTKVIRVDAPLHSASGVADCEVV
jgi:hypothetical protein